MTSVASSYAKPSHPNMQKIIGRLEANDTIKQYDEWAPNFDKDAEFISCRTPKLMKECLSKIPNIDKLKLQTDGSFRILDLAAGTGRLAEELENESYKCYIDAVEGSKAMSDVAQGKKLYQNVYTQVLTEDTPLPFQDGAYDVIVCGCALATDYIEAECLREFVRVTKPGGYIWFTTVVPSMQPDYSKKLREVIDGLSSEITLLVCNQNVHYTYDIEDENGKQQTQEVFNEQYFFQKK